LPGVQILVGRFDGEVWVFPRGTGRIRRSVEQMTRYGRHGIPIQSAEVVLLFKAVEGRPENDVDFAAVVGIAGRMPDHPWLSQL
jgi:hypothetical protein